MGEAGQVGDTPSWRRGRRRRSSMRRSPSVSIREWVRVLGTWEEEVGGGAVREGSEEGGWEGSRRWAAARDSWACWTTAC